MQIKPNVIERVRHHAQQVFDDHKINIRTWILVNRFYFQCYLSRDSLTTHEILFYWIYIITVYSKA
jgi:hypothetical protein